MYSIEVTEREKELGYSLGPVPNPKQVFCTEADEVTAVMYRLDKDNFIIKTIYPVGGYRYCHRQKRDGGWVTVCNEHADPQDAIIKARETISKKQ
jgi:hypothetical protein